MSLSTPSAAISSQKDLVHDGLAGMLAGLVVGLVDAVDHGAVPKAPALLLIAPLLTAAVGAPLGLLAGAARRALTRWRRPVSLPSWVAAGVLGALVVGSLPLVAQALHTVQSGSLRGALSQLALALTLIAAGLLFGPLRRGFLWLEGRARAAFAALAMAGSALALAWMADTLERLFGPPGRPLWLAPGLATLALVGRLLPRTDGARWARRGALFLGPLAALLAVHLLLAKHPERLSLFGPRGPANAVLGVVQSVSDLDGDGAPALFGGQDCAPFDASIRPGVLDLPGDGVDQNCSGADDVSDTPPRRPEPTPTWEGPQPDIVWFIIDAVRADHASVTGYEKPTTPELELLAEESWVFERAYSQSSATMLSVPSMLTGQEPLHMTWDEQKGKAQMADSQESLAEMLKKKGYFTALVTNAYFRSFLPSVFQGYDTVRLFSSSQTDSSPGAATLALGVLHEARIAAPRAPLFLTVYLPAPHAPYVAPKGGGYPDFGDDERGLYDGEIAVADRYVGMILDGLRSERNDWKKTVVIALADHGEEFEEHGGSEHARTCHIESVHVPLVVRIPKVEPRRVATPVALVDVVPTLAGLLGIEVAEGQLDGTSLYASALAAPHSADDRPLTCAVVGQNATQGAFYRRAVRAGRYALFEEPKGSTASALYDTEADPKEQNPLPISGQDAEVASFLASVLRSRTRGNLADVDLTDGR